MNLRSAKADDRIAFLVPGAITQLSGGYGYARSIMAVWERRGLRFRHIELPGDYPFPNDRSLERTASILAALPPGGPVLIDGLAFGAMPHDVIVQCSAPIVVLLHHPLGLETGLDTQTKERLIAMEKSALSHARAVIVTSEATARTVADIFHIAREAIVVAPPGLTSRPKSAGEATPPLILCVASLIPRKGHMDLLQALAGLTSLGWRAAFVGSTSADIETVAAIEEAIAAHGLGERIALTGAIDGPELDELYRRASIFALPSYYEGYGMVFAEAMSAGLPVIGYHAGAVPDLVPERAGLLVPVGDVTALRHGLESLLGDPMTRDRMAEAAFATAGGLPDWEDTASLVHDTLCKAVMT